MLTAPSCHELSALGCIPAPTAAGTGVLTYGDKESVIPGECHGLDLRLMVEELCCAGPILGAPDADLTVGVSILLP